ncbi:uncharacterized protein LOC128239926 [Mya arenaria]|uniref:uncharacterized protein LOC128239926 n=1 Tax=Mya arenaria TaxID=6604 RepID=UPI0022E3764D|nr:uncharacterized protein LOC128239926 [Mya arenaria]
MDRNPENHVLSLRLSRVFEDIGVTGQMVNRRRRTWLATEKFNNVVRHFFENTTRTKYTFGSQSEGSTTLGMNSDVDMLDCKSTPVLIDLTEWKPGRDCLLVLKNENSPPQHCNLQLIRPDLPMPITLDLVQDRVDVEVDGEGKVLLKNTNWDPYFKRLYRDEYVQQGPSRSGSKNIDIVNAYHCFSLLEECQILFKRPRPGHWPRPAVMTQAKATGTFLIPQGHAESHYPKIEWRFSTSIIERLLMFDLDTIKLKVYICLKMLRKTYFKPIVGDRLSTFHFKTALLFTIETYPPEIWQEHNLVQCVIYCLTTLERWCRMSHCPHYTISGVDLFVGKLKRFELPRIATILLDMRENLMVYVVHIEMDQLGKRMLRLSETSCGLPIALPTRHENILSIVMTCFHNLLTGFLTEPFFYNLNTSNISRFLDDCKLDAMYTYMLFTQDGTSYFSDVFGLYIKFLSSTLATTLASRCIELQQPITAKVYNL